MGSKEGVGMDKLIRRTISTGCSLVFSIVLLEATVFSNITSADYLGGKFPHSAGSTTTLYYTYSSPHRYSGNAW